MKAIRVHEFGAPEVLRLEEIQDLQPNEEQILVRIEAAGVNPVEAYIRSGQYPMKPSLPYTPGSDAAGMVEAAGRQVSELKKGDRVYVYRSLTGTYAEYALCTREQVFRLPQNISFSEGAAIGIPVGTAYRALFTRGQARRGETVLIHGATGGVGISAVQLAAKAGLTVIGTASSPEATQFLKEHGATHVLGHDEANNKEAISKVTDGKGVNLILEMLANANLAKDLEILAPRGRVVVIGSRGTIEVDPRLAMGKELDIRGMTLIASSSDELHSMHAAIVEALKKGDLRLIVGEELPLAEAAKAHQMIMEHHAFGKLVLIP